MTEEMGRWVTVARFRDLNAADIAASLLRANGIETNLPGEYMSGLIFPVHMVSSCQIRLQVPEADVEYAKELLAAVVSETDTEADFELEEDEEETDTST